MPVPPRPRPAAPRQSPTHRMGCSPRGPQPSRRAAQRARAQRGGVAAKRTQRAEVPSGVPAAAAARRSNEVTAGVLRRGWWWWSCARCHAGVPWGAAHGRESCAAAAATRHRVRGRAPASPPPAARTAPPTWQAAAQQAWLRARRAAPCRAPRRVWQAARCHQCCCKERTRERMSKAEQRQRRASPARGARGEVGRVHLRVGAPHGHPRHLSVRGESCAPRRPSARGGRCLRASAAAASCQVRARARCGLRWPALAACARCRLPPC